MALIVTKKILSFSIAIISILSCSTDKDKQVNIYPVKIGKHWGYVNEKGKYIVNPIYNDADYFKCGLARFIKDGGIGYINSKGKEEIKSEFARGTTFSEGKAFVVRDGEAIECINTDGKVLFSLDTLEWAYNFHEGLAAVSDAYGKTGYINEKGEIVIPLKYDKVGDYSEGLSYVFSEYESGYIDKKGNIVFSATPNMGYSFSEGLVINNIDDAKYGFLDKKGDVIIPFQFEMARDFSEGYSCVKTGGKYGFIDKKGKYTINPQFEYASSFHNGLAVVKKGRRLGYINKKGDFVIDAMFLMAMDFNGEYAFVKNSDEKFGLINRKGEFIITPQFSDAKGPTSTYGVRSGQFNGMRLGTEFVKRYSINGWDGLSGLSTLKEIRSNYKNLKTAGDNNLIFETKSETVDGVRVSEILFSFGEKIYEIVKKHETIWNYSYKSGTKKIYHDELQLKSLRYSLTAEGGATSKTKSIAKRIGDAISSAYGVDASICDTSIVVPISESSPLTTITWSNNVVFVEIVF